MARGDRRGLVEIGDRLLQAWEASSPAARENLADRWHLQYDTLVPQALCQLLLTPKCAGGTGQTYESVMEMMRAMRDRAARDGQSRFNQEVVNGRSDAD